MGQPVPYYDKVQASEFYTGNDTQLNIIVGLQYTCASLYLARLSTVCYNGYAFMLRKRRLDNLSIIGFYLLIVLLTILRFYYCIWFQYEREAQHVTTLLLIPILKTNIGVVQCWMLVELSLYIEQSIRLTQLNEVGN